MKRNWKEDLANQIMLATVIFVGLISFILIVSIPHMWRINALSSYVESRGFEEVKVSVLPTIDLRCFGYKYSHTFEGFDAKTGKRASGVVCDSLMFRDVRIDKEK